QLGAWEAALVASGLPVAGLDADPPKPRVVPAAPLSAAIPGEAELVDVWLTERLPVWRVREALEASMPAAHRLVELHDVWLGSPALPGQVTASVYRATLAPGTVTPDTLRSAVARLLAAGTLPRERSKGTGVVAYDLRPFIEALEVGGAMGEDGATAVLRMTLRHDPERGIGRPEEVLAALRDELGGPLEVRALVRERLVLAPPTPPAPPPPKRRPSGGGRAQPTASASRPRK
ncbi:MAG TPA: DUF2344 domain-containing protein, partial [Candidatus Limnocylindrales bacterium]|nr:DUF2344 domain-containing protein [Candidatus Limnocylindrales bacterium]